MSTVQSTAIPPQSLEAEKSVLGAVLLDERHLHALLIEVHLRPEHFFREQHGEVFAAMLELYESDRKIDHLTVAETLRQRGTLEEAGGAAAIDELAGWVPAAGHAKEYGRIVRERWQLRQLLTATYEIQASVHSPDGPVRELIERAERSVLEVASDDGKKKIRSIADILHEETDKLLRLSLAKTALTGAPSGFKDIDEKTGGFQPGNLIVLAARPSMGKSALVANIAENAVLAGFPVALFSLEMSESELAQRFVASQARIKGEDLRRGKVPESRWQKILDACQRLSQAPLFVDDSSDTGVLEVRAKSRRLHHQIEGGLGLIIIDYLQLMRHEGRVESRVEQVGQISRGLKGLARELNVPVIALSQLSRAVEQRGGDKKPILSDLRECVTGDTLVLLADGRRVPIRQLVGSTPEVLALDERHRIVRSRTDLVWSVGHRPVCELHLACGRSLRATAEHRVLAEAGWRRISELKVGDRVAVTRRLPQPLEPARCPEDRLALLGQLTGDGSHEKRIAEAVFRLPNDQIASLLRQLWASGGCTRAAKTGDGKRSSRVYYTTTSKALAADVTALLLRLGIVARTTKVVCGDGWIWNVSVSGISAQQRFLETVGGFGLTTAQAVGFAPSRSPSANYPQVLESPDLLVAAESDVLWDRVVAIEEAGEEEVFDLTVPGPASWFADGLVSHNSGAIEQDADLVMFIYREEYYDKESERPGEADIIIAKHRNGPVGEVVLTFQKEYPKFMNYASDRFAG